MTELQPMALMDALFPHALQTAQEQRSRAGRLRFPSVDPQVFYDVSDPFQQEATDRPNRSSSIHRRHLLDVLEAACRLCDEYLLDQDADNQGDNGHAHDDDDDEMSN